MQECLTTLWREALKKTEKIKSIMFVPYMRKMLGFRTLQCVLWADLKAITDFFVSHFYLMKTVLCLSYTSVVCFAVPGSMSICDFFCLELPYLKAEHLLKAFWIHSHLLWRQGICLVQLSPSLLLSHKAVVWFTSSSYAWSLILLASAPV